MTATMHVWPDSVKSSTAYAHTRRDGTPKRRYSAKSAAEDDAKRIGCSGFAAYRCMTCGGWHFGRRAVTS